MGRFSSMGAVKSLFDIHSGPISVVMDMLRVQEEVGIHLGLKHMPPAISGWLEKLEAINEISLRNLYPKYCITADMLSPTNKLPVGGAAFARVPKALECR